MAPLAEVYCSLIIRASQLHCICSISCINLTWLIIMILSVIVLMFVVSLQVHSMYWPGVSCQFSGRLICIGVHLVSRPCPRRCPCAMEFRYIVLPLPRSFGWSRPQPCSLNNVHTVQQHHVCHLASNLDVMSDLCNPLASIKRLFLCHVVVIARRLDLWAGNAM